jgi:hypothetical protein
MKNKIILFDMDGVLLIPGGYREALKTSVKRIGLALGIPFSDLNDEHIARFEALSVTNEWDTLAICTALILLEVWRSNPQVRLNSLAPNQEIYSDQPPQFDEFLETFSDVSSLPSCSAYEKIIKDNLLLDKGQKSALRNILFTARDIYKSPILWSHQETVLGSKAFQENYQLSTQLGSKSYLLAYDQPAMTPDRAKNLRNWVSHPDHFAGILTNRPSGTPPGYLSSPEAELGAELIGMSDLPILGSGMLGWFAATHCELPEYTFLKPNPVHALALMQMCYGEPATKALQLANHLWHGSGDQKDWLKFNHSEMIVFEDAVKGLQSGLNAKEILAQNEILVDLKLIGISENSIKKAALQRVADQVFPDINEIDWNIL